MIKQLLNEIHQSYFRKGFRVIFVLFLISGFYGFAQENITITGTVTSNSSNMPLPGVSVLVQGTNNGVVTNFDGNYTISASGNATLVFSYLGFEEQEVSVNERSMINVSLVEDAESLEEVVVVGYGTQTKGTITGAIGSIDAEELIRTPSVTTSGALVGKIQGITARQGDARPGAGTSIEIRNMGDPLYVIDGVPADAAQFNNIGQNDIESISILKDASAAIYGMRAANGVILVTTKKGQFNQKPKINISGYYGMETFTRFPRPVNAYQYMVARAEAVQNVGGDPTITTEELNNWRIGAEGFESYDYYDMVMESSVPQFQVNANVSGGGERVRYYLSATHINQDALIEDYNYNRTNIQANVDVKLTDGLTIGTRISGRLEEQKAVGVPGLDDYFNPLLSIFTMWPHEAPYANGNPNYINQTHNVNVNPATYERDITGYVDDWWRGMKTQFFTEYEFDFGLKARGTYSYNFTNFDFDGFEYTYDAYRYDEATDTYFTQPGWGNQNPWRERRKENIIETFAQFQLSYEHNFNDHNVAIVVAYERSDRKSHYQAIHTIPPNNYIPLMSFADQDILIDNINEEARAGYIFRANYNYKEKYLLEVLGRYDGSFLFPEDSRWGLFPGISAGWVITEENFMQNSGITDVLSNFKIRASYGEIGSTRWADGGFIVPPFSYYSGYTFISSPNGSSIFNGSFVQGVDPRNPPITNLSWITNITKNIGIDFGFFDNKLTGQFDVFERVRKGIPASNTEVVLPLETGYTLPVENLNSDAIKGIEGMLAYSSKIGDVGFSIGVNGTLARKWDIHYEGNQRFGNSWDEYRNSWEERWANINWGYQVIGQFQSQEEIDTYPVNIDRQNNTTLLPGDLIYKDVNQDGIITSEDQRPIGYANGANPYASFGLNGTINYKGFNLLFDFAGATMQSWTREWEMRFPFQNDGSLPAWMFENRWHRADPTLPADAANNPWIGGGFPPFRRGAGGYSSYSYDYHSDYWMTNVWYVRLRNLTLAYDIPSSMLERIKIDALRVYASGTNLFSIDNTAEFGTDPEITSGNGLIYPQQKLLSIGFNLTL